MSFSGFLLCCLLLSSEGGITRTEHECDSSSTFSVPRGLSLIRLVDLQVVSEALPVVEVVVAVVLLAVVVAAVAAVVVPAEVRRAVLRVVPRSSL